MDIRTFSAVAGLFLGLLLGAAPARAEWRRAESTNFIVYGELNEARLRERVALLEEFDQFLRILTGTTAPPAPSKLRVYLVHGTNELRNIARVGDYVAGFYTAGPDGIFATADETENWRTNEDDTLLHEYAHHFMQQYHPAPYPSWYSEGFADYVATVDIRPDRIEYGNFNRGRALWLARREEWVPYDRLLFGEADVNAFSFYSQSWLLVHYIMADEARRAALVRYIAAVGRGEEPRAAFTAAFGMAGAEIDRALHAYAHRITFHRITRTGPALVPPIRIEPIEGGGIDAPLVEAALAIGVRQADEGRLLSRARRAGRDGGAFGQRLQARAEILYGDFAAADRLLDALLAAAPNDPELLYLRGLRHLVAGRRDSAARAAQFRLAQPFFARAFRADPNHYPALFRYAEALSESDQFVSENTQNVLLLATSLAPQVVEIRLAAVHLLLLRDKFEQAEALLLAIPGSGHQQGGASRVQELLRLARARERPADRIVFKMPPYAPRTPPGS
jgi:hypothetical protein